VGTRQWKSRLLYAVDAGSKELIGYNMENGAPRSIASNLPVGAHRRSDQSQRGVEDI